MKSDLSWVLVVFILFSCGSRQVETVKENTSVKAKIEKKKEVVYDYKIKTKNNDVKIEEVDDLRLSIIPNLDKNALDKKCPKSDIIYKDKKGRELRLPYQNQTINLSETNTLKKKLKRKDSVISLQKNKVEQLKKALKEERDLKSKNADKKQSLFFVGLGIGILLMSLIWAVYGRVKNKLKL